MLNVVRPDKDETTRLGELQKIVVKNFLVIKTSNPKTTNKIDL